MSDHAHRNISNTSINLNTSRKKPESGTKQTASSSSKTGKTSIKKKIIRALGLRKANKREKREQDKSLGQIPFEIGSPQPNSNTNLKNVLSSLTVAAKQLELQIMQAESSPDKMGQILVSNKVITVSDLGEAMERQKQEPGKSPGQILCEMGFPQSNSHTNLKNALSSLTAAAKKLEAQIIQAESSPDKIGQILVSKKIITEFDLIEAMQRKKQEPNKYLGQILCEMGIPQSKIMNGIYYNNKRKQLGQVLVELNMTTGAQLHVNLLEQKHLKDQGMHTYLGTMLVKNGIITDENYINALSAHFSMPIVSLKGYKVSPTLQKAVGEQYALKNRIVVLSNNDQEVIVAIAEPHLSVFDYLEKAMPKGKHIMFCLAKASEIEDCLDRKYDPYQYR